MKYFLHTGIYFFAYFFITMAIFFALVNISIIFSKHREHIEYRFKSFLVDWSLVVLFILVSIDSLYSEGYTAFPRLVHWLSLCWPLCAVFWFLNRKYWTEIKF